MLSLFKKIFKTHSRTEEMNDICWLVNSILNKNYSKLVDKPMRLICQKSNIDEWDVFFSKEKRIISSNIFCGSIHPVIRILFGSETITLLSRQYRSKMQNTLPPGMNAELAALSVFTDNLGAILDISGEKSSKGKKTIQSFEIILENSIPALRWSLLDYCCYKIAINTFTFWIVIDNIIVSNTNDFINKQKKKSVITQRIFAYQSESFERPGIFRNEILTIPEPDEFPITKAIVPGKMDFLGKLLWFYPLKVCLCPAFDTLSQNVTYGLRFMIETKKALLPFWVFSSNLGEIQPPSESWRYLPGNIAKHWINSLSTFLKTDIKIKEISSSNINEITGTTLNVAFIWTMVSEKGQGTTIVAFETELLEMLVEPFLSNDDYNRIIQSKKDVFLPIQSINSILKAHTFSTKMKLLSSTPEIAQKISDKFPVAGLPLYILLRELNEHDSKIVLSKLVQKKVFLVQDLIAFFSYSVPLTDTDSQVVRYATPVSDPRSLFSKFPDRWRKEALNPARSPRVFKDFFSLLKAHYDAVWVLYLELLSDRLTLSKTGETMLRMSGKNFENRLWKVFQDQTSKIASRFESMKMSERRKINWASNAIGVMGNPGLITQLVPIIGKSGVEILEAQAKNKFESVCKGHMDLAQILNDRALFIQNLLEQDL